jgi:putative ubiquitin-RnfH superfamily antitoxin RatB of RatAB toxin-antitoxin module
MANPVFDPLPGGDRQGTLPQIGAERTEDLSDLRREVAAKHDAVAGTPMVDVRESTASSNAGNAGNAGNATDGTEHVAVQVCYATPEVQTVIALSVISTCTVKEALRLSGILAQHPEIDLSVQAVGIFGKIKQLDDVITADDRIEIYRPLIVDPKVARARRVAKTRKGGSSEGRKWATRARRSL